MKRLISMSAVLGLVIALPSTALAGGGSTLSGYGGSAGSIRGTVQKSGSLPFTGLSLTFVVLAAIALVALGFAMRRGSRASS
jgi:hypothetical protein